MFGSSFSISGNLWLVLRQFVHGLLDRQHLEHAMHRLLVFACSIQQRWHLHKLCRWLCYLLECQHVFDMHWQWKSHQGACQIVVRSLIVLALQSVSNTCCDKSCSDCLIGETSNTQC